MDLELERFKTEIDLRLYAASQSYFLDRKESWSGSAVMRHSNSDKIVIKRDVDNHYVYFSVRDEKDNGTIIDFTKRRLGLSLGAVRKELRAFIGSPPPGLVPYPAMPRVAKDRIRVERNYARIQVAIGHPYLEQERHIPGDLLNSRRFAGRIRVDSYGNAVFPHFDEDGLCGFELKNTAFTGFASGGSKGLWMSHAEMNDTYIVFCESAIDALSYAVLKPCPYTRFASLGGKPNGLQRELVRAQCAVMPFASIVVSAMDNDPTGRELAQIIRTAVGLTGRSDLRFQIAEPTVGKDWNDQLKRHSLAGRANALSEATPA